MLFSLFLVTFPKKTPILCVYLVFGGLTMAAPMGPLTIKFNSIKFNSLGLLLKLKNTLCTMQVISSDNLQLYKCLWVIILLRKKYFLAKASQPSNAYDLTY